MDRCGNLGSWLMILAAMAVGIMLAADGLVILMVGLVRKAWANRPEMPDFISVIRRAPVAEVGSPLKMPAMRLSATKSASPVAEKTRAKGNPGSQVCDKDDGKSSVDNDRAARPAAKSVEAIKPTPVAAVPKPNPVEEAKLSPAASSVRPRVSLAPVKPAAPKKDVLRRPADDKFVLPSVELLSEPKGGYQDEQETIAVQKRAILQQTFVDFCVQAEVVGHMTGPVITMFEVALAPGVKLAAISNLTNDIARALAVPGIRIVSPLPGKDTIGIEVPNLKREMVRLLELMRMCPDADKAMHLPLYLGKDSGGDAIVTDMTKMPHMLIAGTTNSGKSVCINTIIVSLLMTRTPHEVKLILVDPKMVEMAAYDNVPHLLCPIVNDMKKAASILEWAAAKMDERYELLKEAGVKNIAGYNSLSKEELYERLNVETDEEKAKIPLRLPYYVIIVDELADLMMTAGGDVEEHIIRIAQKARAVGFHLVLATQRPSADVVTGLIKANMPCRVSFRVAGKQDSRIVLDQNGADILLGQGDMLMLQPGESNLIRAQGTYIDDGEIRKVVGEVRKSGQPQFDAELTRMQPKGEGGDSFGQRDELFDQAVDIVLASQRGSVSLLQRKMQIGYGRASRIIDQMGEAGILGDYNGSQARECLITLDDWKAMKQSIEDDQSGKSALNGLPTSS